MRMSERESQIILPRKETKPLASSRLRQEKNGIEIASEPASQAERAYEDLCFDWLLDKYPQDFIIGPRLLDHIGRDCGKSFLNHTGRARPDALILSSYLDTTYLSAIVECKAGNDPDLKSKAKGFMDLVKAVEDDPQAIFNALRLGLGDRVDNLPGVSPKDFLWLDDSLRVIFMTNFDVDPLIDDYRGLKFEYETYHLFDRDKATNKLVPINPS